MSELIEKSPEATAYCRAIIQSAERFRLSEHEVFDDFRPAVLSTTSVDRHNEAFGLPALERLTEFIAKKPYWLNVEHDPLINPQGRVIAARTFHSRESNIYFVAGVIGLYGTDTIKSFKDAGISDFDCALTAESLPTDGPVEKVSLSINPIEIDGEFIDEWMSSRPLIVNEAIQRSIRKEADPITIITFTVSLTFLLKPFLAKVGEKLGDKSGDEIAKFYEWLKSVVFKRFKSIKNDRFRFGFWFEYEGTIVEFIVASKEEELLFEASDKIEDACALATNLIEQLREFEPNKMVIEFDLEARKWRPAYVATKRFGIISDRPTLGAINKMQGLSVGGIISNKTGDITLKRGEDVE